MKIFNDWRLKLRFFGKKVLFLLGLGIGLGFALSAIEVSFATALQLFFTKLGLAPLPESFPTRWIPDLGAKGALILLFVTSILRGVFQWVLQFNQGMTLEEMKYLLRSRVIQWAFFGKEVNTSLASVLFNERTNNAAAAIMCVQVLIVRASTALLLGVALFRMQFQTTAYALSVLFVLGVSTRSIDKKIIRSSEKIKQSWDSASSRLVRGIRNRLFIRIHGMEANEAQMAEEAIQSNRSDFIKYHHASGLKYALPQIFGAALSCLIAYFLVTNHSVAPGTILAYLYLFLRFTQCVAEIAKNTSFVALYQPHVKNAYHWWVATHQAQSTPLQAPADGKKVEIRSPLGWTLNKITFRYENNDRVILSNYNLKVKPGSTVIITGRSGAGKSTLLGLLLGLLTPESGGITIEAEEKSFDLFGIRKSVLGKIGYVGPESFLLDATIRENLLYGSNHSYTDQEIQSALDLAECSFVNDLPKKLGHKLTEQGEGLSAGQKQRLCLARAFLRDPKALILDEATANLDFETESKIVATLEKLKGKMTLIVVTHRDGFKAIADQRAHFD